MSISIFKCFITNELHVGIIEIFRRIHCLLNWFLFFFSDIGQFFWMPIYLSVIINSKIIYSSYIIRCCMWSIFLSMTKIIIYSHRVYYLSRPKSLANYILNIHSILKIVGGFKLIFILHIYCDTNYVNNWFTTKVKVGNIFVHLYFCHY